MMTTEDRKKALTTPSSVFKHPAEVVDSRDFDRVEKTNILKQWELDARLLRSRLKRVWAAASTASSPTSRRRSSVSTSILSCKTALRPSSGRSARPSRQ